MSSNPVWGMVIRVACAEQKTQKVKMQDGQDKEINNG
jgi:hypothetical protein